MPKVIQMRQRGAVIIPKEIREKYKLDDGDPLTMVDLGEGIFLSPKRAVLPKLVAEIETLRQKYNISLEALISGVDEERYKTEYSKVADRE
jgi:AbrB family looped-hinge helix DNA binding protein